MGSTALEPGAETTVSLSMHMGKGMEGPHLFRVTVPVQGAAGEIGKIELYVRANFQ